MFDRESAVVEHIPSLRRYARALVGDPDLADDLVQDTLARALSRLTLWGAGNMRAWLFTIMHNLFVNQVRRRSRENGLMLNLEDVAEPACSASDAANDVSMKELVWALQSLPSEQREVVLLVSLEGLSYKETAKVLGIPQGTVMSRLHRGRERLRETLQEETEEASGNEEPVRPHKEKTPTVLRRVK